MSGLALLMWLETCRTEALTVLMIAVSALGSEEAYLIIMTVIYLCVSHRRGFQLILIFLASGFTNALAKEFFATIRPFVVHPQKLDPLYASSAAGPALPSGHAQNAASIWGLIAVWTNRWLIRIILLLLILTIGFSRLYCQLHWPVDVAAGWLLGAIIVAGFLYIAKMWQESDRRLELLDAILLVAAVSGLMAVLGRQLQVVMKASGAMLGGGIGYTLLEARGGYKARAPAAIQATKIAVAIPALLGVRMLADTTFGESFTGIFFTYVLVGITCTFFLPMLFIGAYHWRRRARRAMQSLQEEDETPPEDRDGGSGS